MAASMDLNSQWEGTEGGMGPPAMSLEPMKHRSGSRRSLSFQGFSSKFSFRTPLGL